MGAAEGVSSINDIVSGIKSDIDNLKKTMENMPPFPKGQRPPQELAKFQNNLTSLEKKMMDNIGFNNSKVFP